MQRHNFSTATLWEPLIGYSRAVRVGPFVYISGTTATDASGQVVGRGDAYAQARQALMNIRDALQRAGAGLEDVVRTRMFVINVNDWQQIGRAHGEFFGAVRPTTTMVEVSRLIAPEMLIEIEAEAVVGEPTREGRR